MENNIININKIAKKIISRSQMVKKCSIDENNICKGYISVSIFLNQFTYNFKGLKNDVLDFVDDVNKQLININISNVNQDDIKLDIDENGLLKFIYEFKEEITDQQKQKIRQFQWIVNDVS